MALLPWILLGAVTLYAFLISIFHFYRNPLPFPDRGSRVFTCPSLQARAVVVHLLEHFGLQPRFRHDTQLVQRAIFWDGTIVNVTDPTLHERMGKPGAGLALVVRNPTAAARDAWARLEDYGFSSRVIEDPDPDLPSGALAFVVSEAFRGWVLVFRKHITKLGPMPPRWNK